MRVIVQRVASARVDVEEGGDSLRRRTSGAIGPGLLVLAGFEAEDKEADLTWMSSKLTRLRIFADENGVMNRSVIEAGGEILAVSQFTLFASVRKGNRPSWSRAAAPAVSSPLFDRFVACLQADLGKTVATGIFGADMKVQLLNDGPVTLFIDSRHPE